MLKSRLKHIADKVDIDGFEYLLQLSAEAHLDLEIMLNREIDRATDKELEQYICLRYLFRIFLKYGRDMQQGLDQLTKYENDG